MLTRFILLFDLILIPAVWCFPSVRINFYTALAIANAAAYFLCMGIFFFRLRKDEKRCGHTLQFVLIQILLPAALFLFKLTELLLAHACA